MARSISLVIAASVAAIGAVVPMIWHDRSDRIAPMERRLATASSLAARGWPDEAATLDVQTLRFPDGFGTFRIFVDAGHGALGNKGNVSSWCEDEQDFTLSVARHLVDSLAATGHFEARVSRQEGAVSYADRVRQAESWGAHAFVSLHSDVRGAAEPWSPRDGMTCMKSDQAPGFAILFSDEGPDAGVERRQEFAVLIAERMETAGFRVYDGVEYAESYEATLGHPGVFVDRHAIDKRIFVLRKPSMPSVLIETHNALFVREAVRWHEPRTLDAFDAAVASALIGLLAASDKYAPGP